MPCPIDCWRHVQLPLPVIICRVEIVFFAEGRHACAGSRASQQNSSSYCRAALPFGALARGSFTLSPTKLGIELAEFRMEVTMVGWSLQCFQSLRSAVVDVPDETVTVLAVCRDVHPPSWPFTTPLGNGARQESPQSRPRGCRKRVNELE